MSERCYSCNKEGATHRWGSFWLCDGCHKIAMRTHKTKKDVDIVIPEHSAFAHGGGCYECGSGKIYLYKSNMGFPIELILHHEIMHHVLNTCIDPPTAYDWDNISPNGEIDKFVV